MGTFPPNRNAFEKKMLSKIMHAGGFYTKIINLDINGKTEKVLPKVLQYHPVTDKLIHFDFLRVQEDTIVTVEIPGVEVEPYEERNEGSGCRAFSIPANIVNQFALNFPTVYSDRGIYKINS